MLKLHRAIILFEVPGYASIDRGLKKTDRIPGYAGIDKRP